MQTQVIIIGGGIGGLALGQGLKKAGISFIICERDLSRDYRPQGYRLRISSEGHDALEKLLPTNVWELFNKVIITNKLKFTNIDALEGKVVPMERSPPNHADPNKPNTADRHVLRALLMFGLEDDVKFGWEYQEHQLTNDGVRVFFKNGQTIEGNILVAADGANSKVRVAEIPDHKLLDTEGRAIFGKTLLTNELESKFPKEGLQNTTMITQSEPLVNLFLEPVSFTHDHEMISGGKIPKPHNYVYWVLVLNRVNLELQDKELFQLSKEELKKYALQLTENWNGSVRSLIELSQESESSFIRISSFSPNIPEWKTERLTFVGDSIHAMTPIGLGANLAMKDAAILCDCLVKNGINKESLRIYEKEMKLYAEENIRLSRQGGFRLFRQPEFENCKFIQ
ncbi:predicted protein [Naegleria gruberi]|uniref:Predicted protein n=1 Tax=Naegleria gruberi TaxID=5762 RepID=D2V1S3_NAEGR|nr:uncharacterized protein NAEGRDRAFT_30287 [Naegleria gruberi]EFC49210.1 predicted protein [Naegleria gruberi]|eukprot:XP_002681954.1 predicted protein [Naegleria gruberi strain NEG-M]